LNNQKIIFDWTTNERLSPASISEMALYSELKKRLLMYEKKKTFNNLLFVGGVGTGKTTAAKILSKVVKRAGEQVRMIDCEQYNTRSKINELRKSTFTMTLTGGSRVIVMDEFHEVRQEVQSVLVKSIEENAGNTKWIFIVNEEKAVKEQIRDRCTNLFFDTCELDSKTKKVHFHSDADMNLDKWKKELIRSTDFVAEKLGITISKKIYDEVCKGKKNLTSMRKFTESVNEKYLLENDD